MTAGKKERNPSKPPVEHFITQPPIDPVVAKPVGKAKGITEIIKADVNREE